MSDVDVIGGAPSRFTAAARAFRLDAYRMFAQGTWFIIVLFAAFPVLIVGMGLLAPGGVDGMGSYVSSYVAGLSYALLVYPMAAFSVEDQGYGMSLNGVIPVTRARQVIGRYAMMMVCVLFIGAYEALCLVLGQIVDHAPLWPAENVVVILGSMVGYLVVQSILFPLFYRFRAQKALMVFFVGIVVLIGGIALIGQMVVWGVLPAGVVAWVADHAAALAGSIFEYPVLYMCGAFVAALAMFAVSLLISVRIYKAKEL